MSKLVCDLHKKFQKQKLMKIVISCCDRKNGIPFNYNGNTINFVANVNEIAQNNGNYVHPDDLIPNGIQTWRDLVLEQDNRNDLILAHNLYRPNIYNDLFQHYGENLFIFSAGWGIIRADFRLPKYNITFSKGNKIPLCARRNNDDGFNDFNQLAGINENDRILFIAGKEYVLPFCQIIENLPNEKIIVYKTASVLINNPFHNKNTFRFFNYHTNTNTNWHYEFARKLINDEINI